VPDSIVFRARSVHTFAADRIYRVEIYNGAICFLRIGGQFNVDRGPDISMDSLPAYAILGAGELLFRKHRREELIARNPALRPEDLLEIHPHNFKIAPAAVLEAVLLPRRWYAFLRAHHGRLALTLVDETTWEFHFERLDDMRQAYAHLGAVLGGRFRAEVAWDEKKQRFVRVPRQRLE
jgi:hypothetical protein